MVRYINPEFVEPGTVIKNRKAYAKHRKILRDRLYKYTKDF